MNLMRQHLYKEEKMTEISQIAHIECDLKSKFAVPRQSGAVKELKGKIVFERQYSNPEAFRGLDEYTYLWVIWQFSQNTDRKWSPTVRPPILGGNTRVGVFATRSSFRPNNLAMSVVRIENICRNTNGNMVIEVSGIDMMDGTPVFDIKPYIPKWDARNDACGGFTDKHEKQLLDVIYDDRLEKYFDFEQINTLIKLLEQDPRPAYKKNQDRSYGFLYADCEVKFHVEGTRLIIDKVDRAKK